MERAAEVLIDRSGAACEGFVGSAPAILVAALAAFSSPLILFKTAAAITPVFVGALRAQLGQPVVIFAAMIAPFADRHTAER